MERSEFEKIVRGVFDELPPMFREHLKSVELIIEDYPDDELVRDLELTDDDALYGIYEGIPITELPSASDGELAPVMPTIRIFQRELELDFDDHESLLHEVRVTVIHEVGHHFGLDDEEIERLGFG